MGRRPNMPETSLTPGDRDRARELLPGDDHTAPALVDLVAQAVSAERRSHVDGAVTVKELRIAHDSLYVISDVHRPRGLIQSLAVALLARGFAPRPGDYGGDWWLWWPKDGRGPCPSCGKQLLLHRYSPLTGPGHRYLCRRCRAQEADEQTDELNRATGVTPEPDESADSLLGRRISALFEQERRRAGRGRWPTPG